MFSNTVLVITAILFIILVIVFDVVLNVLIKYDTYYTEADYIIYKIKYTDGKYVPVMTIWNWVFQVFFVCLIIAASLLIWYAIRTGKMSDDDMVGLDKMRQRTNTVNLDRPTLQAAAENYDPRKNSL